FVKVQEFLENICSGFIVVNNKDARSFSLCHGSLLFSNGRKGVRVRQIHSKRTAFTDTAAVHFNRAIMHFDKLPGEEESNPETASIPGRSFHLSERFKYPLDHIA